VLTNLAQITTCWWKIYYKKMAWIAKQATEKGFHEITNMNICRIKSGPPITNKILTTNRINAAVKLQAGIQ